MQWEAPPDKGKKQTKWSKVADELRDNPGKWAKLSQGKSRNAHSLAGRLRAKWGTEYEVKSQMLPELDNQAGVWARYKENK